MATEFHPAWFSEYIAEDLKRLGAALKEELTVSEFAWSQQRVPVASGELKATGHVSDPVYEGDSVSCTIGYGIEGQRIGIVAIVQHERTDLAHPGGGQAKYLESAVLEGAPTIWQRVRARAK